MWASSSVTLTSRKVVELRSLEAESLLITEQVGIIERSLIDELQGLCNEENWENDKIELPSNVAHLKLNSSVNCFNVFNMLFSPPLCERPQVL